jgi:hypothetical protein
MPKGGVPATADNLTIVWLLQDINPAFVKLCFLGKLNGRGNTFARFLFVKSLLFYATLNPKNAVFDGK